MIFQQNIFTANPLRVNLLWCGLTKHTNIKVTQSHFVWYVYEWYLSVIAPDQSGHVTYIFKVMKCHHWHQALSAILRAVVPNKHKYIIAWKRVPHYSCLWRASNTVQSCLSCRGFEACSRSCDVNAISLRRIEDVPWNSTRYRPYIYGVALIYINV